MDRSERLAQIYLQSLNMGEVAYELDGRVPPDFLVGGTIAVEVRRLNQNYQTDNGYEGLEGVEAALLRFIERLLPQYGAAPGGQGWWVSYTFWRPVDGKAVKRDLPKALADFQAATSPNGARIKITPSFELEIQPTSIGVAQFFMLGAYSDYDAGGFIASEIIRNLNLSIAEKAAKIALYFSCYSEWWLVLPDRIGPDLNSEERSSIDQHINRQNFSRVILIHPREPAKAVSLFWR